MNYYTNTIPLPLAEKLKEKGMPITFHPLFTPECVGADQSVGLIRPTYGACLDWLIEKGFSCEVYGRGSGYDYVICKECNDCTRGTSMARNNYEGPNDGGCWDTWREAADAAIEKALTLI